MTSFFASTIGLFDVKIVGPIGFGIQLDNSEVFLKFAVTVLLFYFYVSFSLYYIRDQHDHDMTEISEIYTEQISVIEKWAALLAEQEKRFYDEILTSEQAENSVELDASGKIADSHPPNKITAEIKRDLKATEFLQSIFVSQLEHLRERMERTDSINKTLADRLLDFFFPTFFFSVSIVLLTNDKASYTVATLIGLR